MLDEPLSALDESMRSELCKELKKLHAETKATFIHISHNFEETVEVADRIATLNHGEIVQVGEISGYSDIL